MLFAYDTYKELNMSFASEIIARSILDEYTDMFSFDLFVSRIFFMPSP